MKLQYIKAGEIVTTHGVRGEVKVMPWLDSPEDLCDFDRSLFDADRTSGILSPTESFFVGACPAAGKARSQFPYDVSADVFGYFLSCFGHKQRARFRADPAVAAGIKTI